MIRRLAADFGAHYAVSGLIAFIFAATGPVAIILSVGAQGGLAEADLASWLFGAFFINGLISIGFCLAWRQPLVFFWTIPGAVLVGPALGHLSFAEVIGAYVATGLLMLALGLSGWVRRFTEAAPMPIVMAMVAGVFLRFGIGGDPVNGLKHIDILRLFNDDPDTDAVVMIGEIGGSDEETAAQWAKANMKKPVVGFIAGVTAPPGKRMGHAGAIISGGKGTAQEKLTVMEACGIKVTRNPAEMGKLLKSVL